LFRKPAKTWTLENDTKDSKRKPSRNSDAALVKIFRIVSVFFQLRQAEILQLFLSLTRQPKISKAIFADVMKADIISQSFQKIFIW
jgi:hypothetical protein